MSIPETFVITRYFEADARRDIDAIVSLFPVFHCFYHAYIGTLIEEGLLGDNIV